MPIPPLFAVLCAISFAMNVAAGYVFRAAWLGWRLFRENPCGFLRTFLGHSLAGRTLTFSGDGKAQRLEPPISPVSMSMEETLADLGHEIEIANGRTAFVEMDLVREPESVCLVCRPGIEFNTIVRELLAKGYVITSQKKIGNHDTSRLE